MKSASTVFGCWDMKLSIMALRSIGIWIACTTSARHSSRGARFPFSNSDRNEICQHRFRLLGYETLDYGPEIDWHLDRVHDKRAPLEPWCKVPFLEFRSE